MCATVSWGAHESFMHPIFVLKNGCDSVHRGSRAGATGRWSYPVSSTGASGQRDSSSSLCLTTLFFGAAYKYMFG
jgi:hypothetical protein